MGEFKLDKSRNLDYVHKRYNSRRDVYRALFDSSGSGKINPRLENEISKQCEGIKKDIGGSAIDCLKEFLRDQGKLVESWENIRSKLRETSITIDLDIQARLKAKRLDIQNGINDNWITNDYKEIFASYVETARKYIDIINEIWKDIGSVYEKDINSEVKALKFSTSRNLASSEEQVKAVENISALINKPYVQSNRWTQSFDTFEEMVENYNHDIKINVYS